MNPRGSIESLTCFLKKLLKKFMKMSMVKNTQKKEQNCRYEQLRAKLPLQEAISRIKKYGVLYTPNAPEFDAWDQLLACEAMMGSTPVKEELDNSESESKNKNVSVNGNGTQMISDGCKQQVYFELTESKQKVIIELKACNHRTTPIKIAQLLEEFFKEWKSNRGHWLYVAQNWNPRAINRTISTLVKLHTSGRKTINNPSAYFTFLIKKRKKRRGL